MFGLLTNLLEGDKKPPPALHHEDHAPAPAPAADHGGGGGGGGGFDLFHPISSMKSMFASVGSHSLLNTVPTPAPAGGVSAPQAAPPKSNHEQLKAAEASRDQLHDRIDKLGDLTPEQKTRILNRTKGLSGDALVTEMASIDNALKGKNADRALATYAEIDQMVANNPEAQKRISPEMMSTLVTGVANSRTTSDRGQAGILGARGARDAAQTLIDMDGADYKKVESLMAQAGKGPDGKLAPDADPVAEQALILKAVAARKDQYKFHHGFFGDIIDAAEDAVGIHTDGAQGSKAYAANRDATKDIEQFAKDIRGNNRDDLIRNTTLIDIDDKNTSTYDPEKPRKADDKADNDGLFQRFTDSCGPTTAQMVKGEADPVYALKLRKNNFVDPDPNSEMAQEQKKVLETTYADSNGAPGVAVSRQGDYAKQAAQAKMAELVKGKQLTGDQQISINKLMSGATLEGDDEKKAKAALDELRKKDEGHPTDAELAAMRADAGKSGNGMILGDALQSISKDATHVDWQFKDPGNLSNAANTTMPNVDKLLKDGQQVPIRIGYQDNTGAANGKGHFMMVSDVRGAPGSKQYLVSDPYSGATRWVPESDFKSGAFTTKQFDLGKATVTDMYADSSQTI